MVFIDFNTIFLSFTGQQFIFTGPAAPPYNPFQQNTQFANPSEIIPFRQTSAGFQQIDDSSGYLHPDLQTSDLPSHLQQTLPQYRFSTPSPTNNVSTSNTWKNCLDDVSKTIQGRRNFCVFPIISILDILLRKSNLHILNCHKHQWNGAVIGICSFRILSKTRITKLKPIQKFSYVRNISSWFTW